MRVTDKILQNNFITNLAFNTERLYEQEMKVLTNKRINKPSDDPVGVMSSLTIRTRLSEIEQYKRNIDRSKTLITDTETAVTQLADIIQSVNTLTIQGASDGYVDNDRMSISYEVDGLLEHVLTLANSRSESIYSFAGTNNDTAAYSAIRNDADEITSVTTSGSSGEIIGVVGENLKLKININGEDLFESGQNIFDVLIDIRDNLREGNTDQLREDLNILDEAAEKVYNTQAVLGSRLNRITAAESRAEDDVLNFTEFLSDTEDADASQVIIDYQMELLTLQSSLQAGARLLQPKLADFLK